MSESAESVRLTQRQDYQFDNDFGAGIAPLLADEPPPLGRGAGPSPIQLLCAAVGNCLSASLHFALGKYKQTGGALSCEVAAQTGRNAERRLRVTAMTARLTLGVPAAAVQHLDRILGSFEDFCTVTGSVRQAVPITVEVFDATGTRLK